jgi:hypothetical protein
VSDFYIKMHQARIWRGLVEMIPDDIPVKRVACCDLATGCGPEVVKKAGLFSFLVRGQGFQIGLDSSLVTRHPSGRQASCARRGAEREEVERQ